MLTSATSKQVMLLKLLVPWEDQIDKTNEGRSTKYQELVEECQLNGLQVRCEPIEVGCRCSRNQAFWTGLQKTESKGASRKPGRQQKRLWIRRGDTCRGWRCLNTSWGLITPSCVTYRIVCDVCKTQPSQRDHEISWWCITGWCWSPNERHIPEGCEICPLQFTHQLRERSWCMLQRSLKVKKE